LSLAAWLGRGTRGFGAAGQNRPDSEAEAQPFAVRGESVHVCDLSIQPERGVAGTASQQGLRG
jgi:hypothetical protein